MSAAIHVDFSPPTGKLVYEVVEGAGSLEVCLVLANVGSFNKNSTLNTPVTVHLSTIQTAQTLYKPGEFDSSIWLCICSKCSASIVLRTQRWRVGTGRSD